MGFSHGKDAFFQLDNAGGTLQNLTAYILSIKMPREIDMAETSTMGTSAKTYVAGMSDATISLEGRFDPTVDAHFAGLLGLAASQSFEYGPQGNAGGAVKYSGECRCSSYEPDADIGDMVGWSAELQCTGPVTRGTF